MTRDASSFAVSLLELTRVEGDERRLLFRQAFAALADEPAEGPGPLEGIHPSSLVKGVQAALDAGLVDDLGWLSAPAAGRALYTLASALPLGSEQREIGRRALSLLLVGNAETFAAIAGVMARTGGKALGSAPVLSRASLLLNLPLSAGVSDGPFALTLATRKHLAQTWIVAPSTRSLSARRLAARIIERAACEAARRANEGDRSSVKLLTNDGPLWSALARLLEDRESLVWRHAAIARGVLAAHVPSLAAAIEASISPRLGPTEWRRGATALAALASQDPEASVRLAASLFAGDVVRRDPGVVVATVWGLARASETEPDAANEILAMTHVGSPEDVADAVVFLRRELGASSFGDAAGRFALERLVESRRDTAIDDGAMALRGELILDLESASDEPLRNHVEKALALFATDGARPAHAKGLEILSAAHSAVDTLAATGAATVTPLSRRASLAVLRDVDLSLLERDVLSDLIRLDTNLDKARQHEETLGALRGRTARWILDREMADDVEAAGAEPAHLTLRLSRLRALLHLVDSDSVGSMPDGSDRADDAGRAAERSRWQTIAHALVTRIEARPPRSLRRALLATLARALDGLVRSQACDVIDALLVVGAMMSDPRDFDALSEASMDPELRPLLGAYADFLRAGEPATEITGDSLVPPHVGDARLDALGALAEATLRAGSARSGALAHVLTRLAACLQSVARSPSLRALAASSGEPEVVTRFESVAHALEQMCAGARGRIFELTEAGLRRTTASRALSTAVSRVLSGSDEDLDPESLSLAATALTSGIPRGVAAVVKTMLDHVRDLPRDGSVLPDALALGAELPAWLPARRVLGAFYVLRPLSAGAAGSVFVVCRAEDRRKKDAERFALKVPDYSASAARQLSETQFFDLFRSEASALMAIPRHPNLARFVTFDLAARPRPILVMELVEGQTLERLIDTRTLDTKRALAALDQILVGLEAMHEAGVGHLDIKPANVIFRSSVASENGTSGETAVLVDFGLAGRNIRLGCATGPYGAPEVWGAPFKGGNATPMAADVYAFGCLAFEMLTGEILFDADSELAIISQHVSHDGLPPKLRALTQAPRLAPLAELLFAALRRDPSARLDTRGLRGELAKLAKRLEGASWPITAE